MRATQLKFRIGYAPAERFALKEHLGKEGVSVEDMIEAGLVISGDDIPVPYDRFRDRVIFPISDWRGRVIAFGGRALDPDAPAKYLNSPETPLFHKGFNLYNGANARQAAHDGAHDHRGRRLCRCDRDGECGFPRDRRAARHRADRRAAWPSLENGGRAAALFRRRQGRTARGFSCIRYGAAETASRQEPEIRAAAGRAGSRRSRALGRTRGRRRSAQFVALALRHAVAARSRNLAARYAGTQSGAGSAHRRDRRSNRQ